MAEGYNVPKDEGYSVSNNYASVPQNNSNYGGQQSALIVLPIYRETQDTDNKSKKSCCPRGGLFGEIGRACGTQCTRGCAMPG